MGGFDTENLFEYGTAEFQVIVRPLRDFCETKMGGHAIGYETMLSRVAAKGKSSFGENTNVSRERTACVSIALTTAVQHVVQSHGITLASLFSQDKIGSTMDCRWTPVAWLQRAELMEAESFSII